MDVDCQYCGCGLVILWMWTYIIRKTGQNHSTGSLDSTYIIRKTGQNHSTGSLNSTYIIPKTGQNH